MANGNAQRFPIPDRPEDTGVPIGLGQKGETRLATAPQSTGAGTALIPPPQREPTQQELIDNPQLAEQFIGEEEFREPGDALFPWQGINPRDQALQDFQPSPETIEFLNNATDEEADKFAYEFARELSKPRLGDAGDKETFKKIWMQQNGNPYEINPSEQGMEVHKETEREDWTAMWQDTKPFKGFMTEKENKDYITFREQKLVQRKNDAIRERKNQIEALEFGMDQFDKKVAEDRARKKIEIEQSRERRLLEKSEDDIRIREENLRIAKARERRLGTRQPPTPSSALKRISMIRKSIVTLNKGDKVDALMVKLMPEFAALKGTNASPEEKKEMMDAFEKEISYLEGFTPGANSKRQRAMEILKDQGYPTSEANVKALMETL